MAAGCRCSIRSVTLEKQYFPYMVQGARQLHIDGLTLYAGNAGKVAQVTPKADLGALSTSLTAGSATLSLPLDSTVMVRQQTQQVFLVLQYHFGMS